MQKKILLQKKKIFAAPSSVTLERSNINNFPTVENYIETNNISRNMSFHCNNSCAFDENTKLLHNL